MVVKVALGVFIGLLLFVLITNWYSNFLVPYLDCPRWGGNWTQIEPGRWGCTGIRYVPR